MEYSEFIFVDYENVQGFELSSLDDRTRIYIFVGRQQRKIPFELVSSAQSRGDAVAWIQISGQGRNALDFHIAYYLGELNQTTPREVRFTVLSKDTGYDPLIQHLAAFGRQCKRINSLKEITTYSKEELEDPNTKAVVQNLKKIEKSKRPRTRNTLSKHVSHVLRGKLSQQEVSGVVDNLFVMGRISERNGRLLYDLD
jgi:hypothetical protein